MLPNNKTYSNSVEIASYVLAAAALLLILMNGLLVALLAGLLVHSLVLALSPLLGSKIGNGRARIISISALGIFIVTALTFAVWGTISFFQSDAGSAEALLQRMADIVDASRAQCPVWICQHLPDNSEELREMITKWMREHADDAKKLSENAGHIVVRVLLGMVIGAMISMYDKTIISRPMPLTAALIDRARTLSSSFKIPL